MTLVGITTPDVAGAIAAAGGRLADIEARSVAVGDLAALLVRTNGLSWPLLRRSRAALRSSMLTAQRILEAAAMHGPLLPARPGTVIRSRAEASRLLQSQHRPLAEALRLHGRSRQFQVTISWDPAAALAARRHHQVLVAVTRAEAGADSLATRIHDFMSAEQAAFEAGAMRALATVAQDVMALPVDQPDMLINAVVLLAPGAEPALEHALEELDRQLPGDNRIRLIGPLPAISFAAVAIDRPSRARTVAARRLLGVGEAAEPSDLRRAYLGIARAHHPDSRASPTDASVVGAAAEACRLLTRVVEARASGRTDDVLLVDILRQDQQRSI
ncbi:putative gas vesicle synthesis protein, GvpF/L-like [Bradyrhizobium sp. ORS 375]|uniref:GvpL/GvpF family gas vesicle protein n=1 Tax=Bradyrhizobium sp. (strain ORS 375) TaxID=566679 RepID=UPI00024058E8|nr:GvpL/GvpF family gas vesicle protein [Bradyrhizobium sp. ORS 375]CCD94532.1 putative gas vesicle synthesis protein, GvpF/L-like [Bradyrhizobium sp. ORS 375]